MLPAFAGLGLVVLVPVLLLVWLYRALGASGLVLGVVLLAAAGAGSLRVRRSVARRRRGHYTAAELARLDDHGLAVAAARMLRRDGWRVTDLSQQGRPRLYARDDRGWELDVAFRPVATADEDEGTHGPAPLREAGRPGIDRLVRVVVHRGVFSRTDVLWAPARAASTSSTATNCSAGQTGIPSTAWAFPNWRCTEGTAVTRRV